MEFGPCGAVRAAWATHVRTDPSSEVAGANAPLTAAANGERAVLRTSAQHQGGGFTTIGGPLGRPPHISRTPQKPPGEPDQFFLALLGSLGFESWALGDSLGDQMNPKRV